MLRIGVTESSGFGHIQVHTFELFTNKTKPDAHGVLVINYQEKWQQGRILALPSYYCNLSKEELKVAAQNHSGIKILTEEQRRRFLGSVSIIVCPCFPVLALLTMDRENEFSEKCDLRPYFENINCSLVDDH